ncbi:serine/threonine-protein phosphatase 2A activator 1 [Cordyceps javanica]|uniref:Serine/threonine-protein phosphatase 2A activator n=1 Tax=Cordyceps javanica TaxID=43265 RepID=A0A545VT94_9HYPO|nr:serine/threonine-protein phosphatase 2A activator 1 [Cordyceps javanica]TQW04947.1 serine/threonine-protein phosphatase 2A activator 1 [Cordyceps javanica]
MSVMPLRLEVLDRASLPEFTTPVKRIHESSDVPEFLTSLAYRDIGVFIMQLNHAVCPRRRRDTPVPQTFVLPPSSSSSKQEQHSSISRPVSALQDLLADVERLIERAPPAPGPRRFGNLSFRTWHSLLGDEAEAMLTRGALGETMAAAAGDGGEAARREVASYLLGGFGSAQRLDYGTGHELSFVAFLGCLWKLGHFATDKPEAEMEREILITTYTLEPAGSHGVWGLDDHSFVPYIFGSAQLTRPIDESDPMPLEGSVRGAPKTGDVTKSLVVEDNRQSNMYFSAIGFINDIKKGPFWEHSPMLFDISGVKDGWGKINKGMIKMYNAERPQRAKPGGTVWPVGYRCNHGRAMGSNIAGAVNICNNGWVNSPHAAASTAAWATTRRRNYRRNAGDEGSMG